MRVRRPLSMAVGAAGVAAAVAGSTSAAAAGGAAAVAATATVSISPAAVHLRDAAAAPPTTAFCEAHYKIACYEPAQIQQAYNLGPLFSKGVTGKGQTIVIVNSYGSPTVRHDLGVFDKTFHLPNPPSLRVIQPAGPVAKYRPTSNREGWAGETELDVEWSHAMAPDAKILLVETPTSENEGTTGFPAIVKAETYVVNHHLGGVISQSFSATEQTFPSEEVPAQPARRLPGRGEEGRDRAGRLRRQRRGRRQVQPDHLLPPPGDLVAGQRPAGDRGRWHPAA